MRPEQVPPYGDDVDLREFLASMLSRWVLVGVITLASMLAFGYYGMRLVTPMHYSITVFAMPKSAEQASPLGQISSLLSVFGGGGGGSDGTSLRDLVTGRDFILELADELRLAQDPFYNRSLQAPGLLQRLVGGPDRSPEAVQAGIVEVFLDNLELGESDDGAQVVRVKHWNAEAAAQVANTVVQKVFDSERTTQADETRTTIAYLGEELRAAETELNAAIAKIQAFAVDKDIASAGTLQAQSLQLVRLRDREAQAREQLAALSALRAVLDAGGADQTRLSRLFKEHGVLLDRETRALLGAPRRADDWLSLRPSDIARAEEQLEATRALLKRSVTAAEKDAARTATQAGELALLERDAKVAAVAFEAITRQFKERSILSGLITAEGRVFDTAVPALRPTSPQRITVLAVGLVFGILLSIGVGMALFLTGTTIHSRRSLAETLGTSGQLFSRRVLPSFARLRSPKRLLETANATATPARLALSYALNTERTPVVVFPLRPGDAHALGYLAAGLLSGPETRTLILDLARPVAAPQDDGPLFDVQPINDRVDIACPTRERLVAPRAAARPDFADLFTGLLSDYDDGVILLPPPDAGGYLLQGLRSLNPLVLTSVRLGKLRQRTLRTLIAQLPTPRRHRRGLLVLS